MKQFYTKRAKKLLTLLIVVIITTLNVNAQQIYFSFENAQNTNDGTNDYYEVDVMISTDTDFKLGSGQLYLNYNTEAFGENVSANSKIEYTQPAGYILGAVNLLPIYKDFIQNDNTTSRVSLSFQQSLSSGSMDTNNVTVTLSKLFHIKIQYLDYAKPSQVTFETDATFLDQTFTACGSSAFATADCTNEPGTQIFDDNFDNSGATLGLGNFELLEGVNLYPNPSIDAVFVEGLKEKSQVLFYNIQGSLVLSKTNYERGKIELGHLRAGVYLVKIINEEGVSFQKMFKQ
ncbi:Por secretion system C-terminal sorting domain-containing protein [Lutibacter agarilyticus]|uniref:Por secretion system C-terminal sorting domain-containing protein n=1 Tax=Lutibacter agarilyticus TaxID=1109740 RepID=A0A238WIQ7_9FLAO|nr:T9SS type A sorting domain-containing protein [Lutibacter agarilyticus]SNR46114.1 Por secretion system C-terminal sorting domain-containing protein [Lutibacter agarilyticus]